MGRRDVDQQQFDMASLNLQDDRPYDHANEVLPKMVLARETVLVDAMTALEGDQEGKKSVSLVVIGTRTFRR